MILFSLLSPDHLVITNHSRNTQHTHPKTGQFLIDLCFIDLKIKEEFISFKLVIIDLFFGFESKSSQYEMPGFPVISIKCLHILL